MVQYGSQSETRSWVLSAATTLAEAPVWRDSWTLGTVNVDGDCGAPSAEGSVGLEFTATVVAPRVCMLAPPQAAKHSATKAARPMGFLGVIVKPSGDRQPTQITSSSGPSVQQAEARRSPVASEADTGIATIVRC
jgi:hypothetical protein